MVCTKPDIGQAVEAISRFMSNLGKTDWEAVKRIFRYLRGTIDKFLYFDKGDLKVKEYVDAYFASEIDHRRSTTGYMFNVGKTAVSWMSQIKKIITLPTTEVEYIVVIETSKEMIWLQVSNLAVRIKHKLDNQDCATLPSEGTVLVGLAHLDLAMIELG
ncbi:secreted RxLR effector protein 161-like [Malania oleifera]|uniref:secreted RxLR effector protein 161-like n=1 Tax=Malania oleifera TaxID=397392 RepID=UPI0025ADD2D0|nr:secreted RxLR effector protein 161-like [Malania oleifera]